MVFQRCFTSRSRYAPLFRLVLSRYLAWLILCSLLILRVGAANVTFQNTSPNLSYTPSLCSISSPDDNFPEECDGQWSVLEVPGSSNGSVTATIGPNATSGNIVPQLFFTFKGSAVFVKTSLESNATANLTLFSSPSEAIESRIFSPSINFWAFFDLDETQNTTLSVSFQPATETSDGSVTRLDIDFIKISVSDPSDTSAFLPTPIPTSVFSPSLPSTSTIETSSTEFKSNSKLPIGVIVGASVGGSIVLFAIIILALFVFKTRREEKQQDEEQTSTMREQAARQIMAPRPASTVAVFQASGDDSPPPVVDIQPVPRSLSGRSFLASESNVEYGIAS
ncbi:hypothetical protein SCHPADRAFT_466762 [Schizopora paradoxa]|uniref:Mid2 domain-containing protein n=1 Tax=Schizopora paradoxa TaxID=27342 RepID=A0A0H2RI69_9AGAM|nr:hypothetical protein SCHPADRAFT_466762 [Schizopora paradoxa]